MKATPFVTVFTNAQGVTCSLELFTRNGTITPTHGYAVMEWIVDVDSPKCQVDQIGLFYVNGQLTEAEGVDDCLPIQAAPLLSKAGIMALPDFFQQPTPELAIC